MPCFRCFVRGENFPLKHAGRETRLMGFYTTRWVEAADADAAEDACVLLLKADPDLADARVPDNTAKIYVEKIEELVGHSVKNSGSGFTFFEMDSE